MTNPFTIAGLLSHATRHLAGAADPTSAALDAQLLLAQTLHISRGSLLAYPDRTVEQPARACFEALVARRAAGEPLAYLTGHREFWSLDLEVTPDVLVPRPETEHLVERALALLPATHARIVDLGTGSGAIALALASERPQWWVLATDASPAALEVARRNAAGHRLAVEFRQGSWYVPLAGERFDLIASNPPYVAADDPALAALRHEPHIALTPGADPMSSLNAIAGGAVDHLTPGGWLLLEHGSGQGAAVRAALVLAGLRHVRSHPDLAGHERVTEGQR
ncbi:MAG: peptide chain release factor N(5)-glutamine methyltransferase [Proteobacteria bacterium]|nr:peptide chain release factor N(5)-glutamine methyltransferase [Pseudomonadota bacterium]